MTPPLPVHVDPGQEGVRVPVDPHPARRLHHLDRRRRVVAVAVAQDHAVDVAEVHLQELHVVHQRLPVGTRVEDHLPRIAPGVDELQEEGEPPLAQAPGLDEVLRKSGDLEIADLTHSNL